jgi:two-component system KDP operon response regulator KdpE
MDNPSLRVLVVDDERPIRRFFHTLLSETYTVIEAESGHEALEAMMIHHPDVVLLDLQLPDMAGLNIIQRLREWTNIPIIVISVLDNEATKIAALDNGADDYLTKPFSAGELMARIRAALRHAYKTEGMMVYKSGDLEVNLSQRVVRVSDRQVTLTPTEYDILRTLVSHAGMVLTHQQLIHRVWGGENEVDAHLLRVNISNLRRKIENDPLHPRHIITEPGVGYRLKLSDQESLHRKQTTP